jgi:nucleoid-associated protein EbfC
MGSGFSKLKKQARLAQKEISDMQEKLSQREEEGSAGNGLVSLILSGEKKLKKIKIQKECVDVEDIEGLEDLILAAHKDAFKKLEEKEESDQKDPLSLFF